MKTCLITGGCGFQGVHIVKALAGLWKIRILNTPSLQAHMNVDRGYLDVIPDVTLIWGSVTDPEIISKALEGCDAVIHLAACASVDRSIDLPKASLNVNLWGTYYLLEALRKHPVRAIIASSCEVYGAANGMIQGVDAPLNAHSPYAASKVMADRLAYAYAKTYGLNLTILRPCNIYGPHQRAGAGGAVIPTMTLAGLNKSPITVTGDGQQSREYMHVHDLARAYSLVLGREDLSGQVFNLGSREPISIYRIASIISKFFSVDVRFTNSRPGDVTDFCLDTSYSYNVLGFTPQITFWQGLQHYLERTKELGRLP